MDGGAFGVGSRDGRASPRATSAPVPGLQIDSAAGRVAAIGLQRSSTRRSSGAREDSAAPSSARSSPKLLARYSDRAIPDSRRAHDGGAPSTFSAVETRSRSSSVSAVGPYCEPSASLAIGVDIESALALEHAEQDGARRVDAHHDKRWTRAAAARRRSSPAIAARSPDPAKRCARPQLLSASAAGRRSVSMVPNTSIAAASRAAGVMTQQTQAWIYGRPARMRTMKMIQAMHSVRPPMPKMRAAQAHLIAGGVHEGMAEPRQHENPGQHQKDDVGVPRNDRQDRRARRTAPATGTGCRSSSQTCWARGDQFGSPSAMSS